MSLSPDGHAHPHQPQLEALESAAGSLPRPGHEQPASPTGRSPSGQGAPGNGYSGHRQGRDICGYSRELRVTDVGEHLVHVVIIETKMTLSYSFYTSRQLLSAYIRRENLSAYLVELVYNESDALTGHLGWVVRGDSLPD